MTDRKISLSNLNYFRWKEEQKKRVVNQSNIALTYKGAVEYSLQGKKGPVIAAIHGEPGNIFQCEYIFAGLRSPNFRYLAWSRPGYLGTPLESGKTIKEQSELFLALLDFLGINKVAIIGFSFGGVLAMDFAIRYPERACAIILDASVAKRIPYGRSFYRYMVNFFAFSDIGNWISSLVSSISKKLSIRSLIKCYSNLDGNEIKELLDDIANDEDMSQIVCNSLIRSMTPFSLNKRGFRNDARNYHHLDTLAFNKISAPVLIIHGDRDGEVPFEHGVYLSKTIANAEFLHLKGSMHFTLLSNEDEVTKKKFSFLNRYVLKKEELIKGKSIDKKVLGETEKAIFAKAERIADSNDNVLLVDAIEIYPSGNSYHIAITIEVSSRLNFIKLKPITDDLKSKIKDAIPSVSEVFIQTMPSGFFASTISQQRNRGLAKDK